LRSEGTSAPVLLWALANQVRTLVQLNDLVSSGRSFENAANQLRIWKNKMTLTKRAQQRLNNSQLLLILRKCAHADKLIKGVASGDEWNELLDIVLRLCGVEALNKRSQKLVITAARAN
jgi:DNA polymerase-3 subunit delta